MVRFSLLRRSEILTEKIAATSTGSGLGSGLFSEYPMNGYIINPVTGTNRGVIVPIIDKEVLFIPISSCVSLRAVSINISFPSCEPPGKDICPL